MNFQKLDIPVHAILTIDVAKHEDIAGILVFLGKLIHRRGHALEKRSWGSR